MSAPFLWSSEGDARISVSPHAVARLHALPEAEKARLLQMLSEIAGSHLDSRRLGEGLLRLHVGAFVVLYCFEPSGDGLVVQHLLVPTESDFTQMTG